MFQLWRIKINVVIVGSCLEKGEGERGGRGLIMFCSLLYFSWIYLGYIVTYSRNLHFIKICTIKLPISPYKNIKNLLDLFQNYLRMYTLVIFVRCLMPCFSMLMTPLNLRWMCIIKGTASVILSNPTCKNGIARFTTVPTKPLFDQKYGRYRRFSD